MPFRRSKLGVELAGEIGADDSVLRGASDVDTFRFTPSSSGNFRFDAQGAGEVMADTFLRVFSLDGTEIGFNDDVAAANTNSQVSLDLESGTEYLVTVSGSSDRARDYNPTTGTGLAVGSIGTYTLAVEASEANPFPWQNPSLRQDVDNDGFVIPFDALEIINRLNRGEGGPLQDTRPDGEAFLDVFGDNFLSPFDALEVINYLNGQVNNGAVAAVTKHVAPSAKSHVTMAGDEIPLPENESSVNALQAAAIDVLFDEFDEFKLKRKLA